MTLKEARKALGWTQQDLEAKSGVPQQQISALETGRYRYARVSYESVMNIVIALQKAGMKGLTATELFPIEESQPRA